MTIFTLGQQLREKQLRLKLIPKELVNVVTNEDIVDAYGNLTEGLTVFELKDGKLMRRVGIGVCHPSKAAPDAASSVSSL